MVVEHRRTTVIALKEPTMTERYYRKERDGSILASVLVMCKDSIHSWVDRIITDHLVDSESVSEKYYLVGNNNNIDLVST